MSRSPKVVAVVVTWNRKDLLARNLRATLAQTRPVDEVLVIDNASTDGTAEMLAAEFPSVRVIRLAGNAGSAGGFHVGVREGLAMGADWLWLMDDDGYPSPGCLAELLRVAEREGYLIVGPVVRSITDPRKLALPVGAVSAANGGMSSSKEHRLDAAPCSKPPFFNGVLVQASAARRAGPPKAEMFIWGEDNEYAERLRRLGYRAALGLQADYFHPDQASRGWWLIDLKWGNRRIRHGLVSCSPDSERFTIVARNLGYRMPRYYGWLATLGIFAIGVAMTWRLAGPDKALQFARAYYDGMTDRYATPPSRSYLADMLKYHNS